VIPQPRNSQPNHNILQLFSTLLIFLILSSSWHLTEKHKTTAIPVKNNNEA
jgi:hypothetical protein